MRSIQPPILPLAPSLFDRRGGSSSWMAFSVALVSLGLLAPQEGGAATRKARRSPTVGFQHVEFGPGELSGFGQVPQLATMHLRFSGFGARTVLKLKSETPPALLLHGLGYQNGVGTGPFRGVLPLLREASHPVIMPDLMGHGESSGRRRFSMKFVDQAQAMALALEKMEVKEVHVVGHSYGGGVAAVFAAQYPHLVKTVTLIGAVHPFEVPRTGIVCAMPIIGPWAARFGIGEKKFTDFQRSHYHELGDETAARAIEQVIRTNYHYFSRQAFGRGTKRIVEDVIAGKLVAALPPPLRKRYFGDAVNPIWQRNVLDVLHGWDSSRKLVIWGEHDKLMPVESVGIKLAEAIDSRIVVVRGAHTPQAENPGEVVPHLLGLFGNN